MFNVLEFCRAECVESMHMLLKLMMFDKIKTLMMCKNLYTA